MYVFIYLFLIKPLFNQEDLTEIKNLFFKSVLVKTGSSIIKH